ncbi:MAG TPA: glycosyltransferase family 2 protein [Anaerolineales bacterium]
MSVIVPCYNEQATIGALLAAIHDQTYPRERLEVVIADGLSEDGTRDAIAAFQQAHPTLSVRLVDNGKRTIPAGLNRAIGAAEGEFIIRLDAHSKPIPEYVQRCVEALQAGKGTNVGGVWQIVPGAKGRTAAAIAAAAAHPLGAGNALYRVGGAAGAVDTVPFGAFRRSLIDEIGGFDEQLRSNEDYEFNVRINKHGGVVWMDPAIKSTYYARTTLAALARQYWRYGFWKFRMLVRYPTSLRWRQAIPPTFVLAVLTLAAAAIFWTPALIALVIIGSVYALALLAASVQLSARAGDLLLLPALMLAFATVHFAWGGGFLASIPSWWVHSNG